MKSDTVRAPDGEAVEVPETGWIHFHERTVMLQLREPYIGVEYTGDSYRPSMADGGVKATPMLSGVLSVEPNGEGGVMLILRRYISGRDQLLWGGFPRDVLYCTHIEQSSIIG